MADKNHAVAAAPDGTLMKQLIVLLISLTVFTTACATTGSVFTLSVGDCFNDPDDPDGITHDTSVEIVDCETPHDNQVYALFAIAGESFPGQTVVQQEASVGCSDNFAPYVGAEYSGSMLDISFLAPSKESWDRSDGREVVCVLFDRNGALLTGSVEGTGV